MKKRIFICIALVSLMLAALVSCGSESNGADGTSEATAEASEPAETSAGSGELILSKDSEYSFTVIRPEDCDSSVTEAAVKLRSGIAALGITVSIKDDWIQRGSTADPEAYEILVGKTNRDATANAEVPAKSYVIKCIGNKIVICGDTDTKTLEAVDYFIENFVNKAENGEIHIPKDTSVVITDTKAYFYELINSENSYGFTMSRKNSITATTTYKYVQGGCSDGTYYYVSVIYMDETNQNNNLSLVYKYDMSTWQVVAQKEGLALCHCNDMCYNPDTKLIYVANNTPQNTKITMLDPETLEIKDSVYIKDNIYSITYSSSRKQYVVGISGCENFAVYDSNFNRVSSFNGTETGYVKQGLECDDKYIYVLYYQENCIMIYDWSGTFVSRMNLPEKLYGEPEHLCIVDDYLIIGTNGTKLIYKLVVTKEQ